MDDIAAAGRDHGRQHRPAHQIGAHDVNGEHPRPHGGFDVDHRTVGIIGRRGVDQNIDPAEGRLRRFGGGAGVRLEADVAAERLCTSTGARDYFRRILRHGGVYIGTQYCGAGRREQRGDGAANPVTSSGDDRRLPGECRLGHGDTVACEPAATAARPR